MREINLLPPSRRNYLRRQSMYDLLQHFVQHVNVSLLILTVAGVATLLILRGFSILATDNAEEIIPQYLRQYQEGKQFIEQQNRLVTEAHDADSQRIIWTNNLREVFSVLPPGTIIDRISTASLTRELTIAGATVNRNSLTLLTSRLNGLSWVQEVKAPLANLLDRENPSFSFTLVVKQPGEVEETPSTSPSPTPSPTSAVTQ